MLEDAKCHLLNTCSRSTERDVDVAFTLRRASGICYHLPAFNDNDDDAVQISPTILTSCDEVSEKELGSMRHRRAENRTIASFGRSEMTSRLNMSASSAMVDMIARNRLEYTRQREQTGVVCI
jgi:hypothetical protein